ncbi:MAG: phytochelatin synthase family protein [Bdellovibrionota bacterium]
MRFSPSVTLAILCLVGFGACNNPPKTAQPSQPVLDWTNDAAQVRLERAEAKKDFFVLANQFQSQTDKISCGPTTGTVVLNALRLSNSAFSKPVDTSLLDKKLTKHLPEGFDARIERYTPNAFFSESATKVKTPTQLYGEPIQGKKDFGLQLRQLHDMLIAHGLASTIRVVDNSISTDKIRDEMKANLAKAGDFVIVNYKRSELGQEGGGHISPVGAYDSASDSFLVMDVNPSKAPWVWVTTDTLVKAMKTMDTVENRGYLLVAEGTLPHSENKESE